METSGEECSGQRTGVQKPGAGAGVWEPLSGGRGRDTQEVGSGTMFWLQGCEEGARGEADRRVAGWREPGRWGAGAGPPSQGPPACAWMPFL